MTPELTVPAINIDLFVKWFDGVSKVVRSLGFIGQISIIGQVLAYPWSIFEKLPEYRNRIFLFILWRIFSGFSKWQLLQRYVMNLLIWAYIPVFASRLALLAYPDNHAFSNCVCPDALCPCHFPCPAFEGGLEVTTPAAVVAEIQVVIEDALRNIKYEWIVFNNYVIETQWKSSWYLLIPRCRISFLVYVYLKKTILWLVNIALYR